MRNNTIEKNNGNVLLHVEILSRTAILCRLGKWNKAHKNGKRKNNQYFIDRKNYSFSHLTFELT